VVNATRPADRKERRWTMASPSLSIPVLAGCPLFLLRLLWRFGSGVCCKESEPSAETGSGGFRGWSKGQGIWKIVDRPFDSWRKNRGNERWETRSEEWGV